MNFLRVMVLTFGAAIFTMWLSRTLGWPYWTYFALCAAFGLLCYVVSVGLIGLFIEKRAPEMATNEEFMPGTQKWETTVGTGVVPKWVSWIGLLSFGFILAMPFELLASWMR